MNLLLPQNASNGPAKSRLISSFANVNVGSFEILRVPSKTLMFLAALNIGYMFSRDGKFPDKFAAATSIRQEISSQTVLDESHGASNWKFPW